MAAAKTTPEEISVSNDHHCALYFNRAALVAILFSILFVLLFIIPAIRQ